MTRLFLHCHRCLTKFTWPCGRRHRLLVASSTGIHNTAAHRLLEGNCRTNVNQVYHLSHSATSYVPQPMGGVIGSTNSSRGASQSTNDNKHLKITADSPREEIVVEGVVTSIWQETEHVKGFNILVTDPQFTFKAGQWVDTIIPGMDTVGGFSLCSPPHLLPHTVTLAIKWAMWPPAHWFHTQCQHGSVVRLRTGGAFSLDLWSYNKENWSSAKQLEEQYQAIEENMTENSSKIKQTSSPDVYLLKNTADRLSNIDLDESKISLDESLPFNKLRTQIAEKEESKNTIPSITLTEKLAQVTLPSSRVRTRDAQMDKRDAIPSSSKKVREAEMDTKDPIGLPILLIGGGVGINPLASMFRHAAHYIEQSPKDIEKMRQFVEERRLKLQEGIIENVVDEELVQEWRKLQEQSMEFIEKDLQSVQVIRPKVLLLYSAKTDKDFLFKTELDDAVRQCGDKRSLCVRYITTRTPSNMATSSDVGCNSGRRINKDVLAGALRQLCDISDGNDDTDTFSSIDKGKNINKGSALMNKDNVTDQNKESTSVTGINATKAVNGAMSMRDVQVYICGPPGMIESMEEQLLQLGLSVDQVHYEKWW